MAAITGRVARIRYTSAGATNSTNEAATLSTDGVTLTINATAKRHWDRGSTLPSVFVSGATATVNADDKTIDHVRGIVTFATAHSTLATYTMDVDYLTASYWAGGREWSLDVEADMLDVTTFPTAATGAALWRTHKAGLSGASASIGRLWSDGSSAPVAYDNLNVASSNFILELWNSSANKYEAFARIDRDSLAVEPDQLVVEDVSFTIDGQIHYTTV